MSDGFTATVIDTVTPALKRLGDTALKYTKPACLISANSIDDEATRRVRRDTGETAQGIGVVEMTNGEGYVVYATNRRMPNLPLWIEAGTKRGKPGSHTQIAAPFFYQSVRLEEGAHARRIIAAVDDAIRVEGLGS